MKFLYENLGKFTYREEQQEREYESDYLTHYIRSSTQISDKNAWKEKGFGAAFRGVSSGDSTDRKIEASVNGIALADGQDFFYSITVDNMSGIFRKNMSAERDSETHVIHSSDMEFYDLDYCAGSNLLAASVKNDPYSQNIALFDLCQGDYSILTDGDSLDRHPRFSQSAANTILFDSCGIGRDSSGNFVEYGPSSLYRLDTMTNNIEEIISAENRSLVCPKDDAQGNLYYIERPAKIREKKPNIFIEVLLIPFKLIYAIYRFLESFTMLFTGKTFTSKSSGDNPAKNKSEREIFFEGNLIEAEKNLKKNRKRREKFPGIAPDSWKLLRRTPDGSIQTMMNGVISFDVDADGNVLYTNGKNVLLIKKDGNMEKLADAALCKHVSSLPAKLQARNSIF